MNDLNKKQIKNKSLTGILLDIDDTICATNLYIARLFNEQYGNAEGLSSKEIVAKYRYPSNVPSWQIPRIIKEQDDIFNRGLHIPFCQAVDQSLKYVSRINSIIPISGYLTSRPDKFYKITLQWLLKQGFPKKPIIMRPGNSFDELGLENGFHWKAKMLESLSNVLGAIDDSLGITNYLPSNYQGIIFLYSHGEQTPRFPFTRNCPTWKEVYEEVTKVFKK